MKIRSEGLTLPSYRSESVYSILNKYIHTAAMLGGMTIGLLTILGNVVNAAGSTTGILLSVSILYKYYEKIKGWLWKRIFFKFYYISKTVTLNSLKTQELLASFFPHAIRNPCQSYYWSFFSSTRLVFLSKCYCPCLVFFVSFICTDFHINDHNYSLSRSANVHRCSAFYSVFVKLSISFDLYSSFEGIFSIT